MKSETKFFALFIFNFLFVFVISKNVLLIIADDAGKETPVYMNENVKTPNLDDLAKRSVIFDSAFTSVSSCSPSRAAILTGLPQHQSGMYGLHQGYHHFSCFNEVRSLTTLLRKNDIYTGIIGKKHVGPQSVFNFNYEQTELNNSILQVGRNITRIKELVKEFLRFRNSSSSAPFFLYVAFHDPHRCGHTHPEFGQFCEKFGTGKDGMGFIPDWKPVYYDPNKVKVPYFVQDTRIAREDIAAQYTTISRLDQGIGLVIKELRDSGLLNDTLIIYSSDNGIPFPSGRTNAYEPGMIEPFLLSSPFHSKSHGRRSKALVSLLDIVPTVLDWYNITYPSYRIQDKSKNASLTGRSLLSLLNSSKEKNKTKQIYFSHSMHEITMYYPIRSIRTKHFKLIHNLNYKMPFPIDQDFYISPTFQDLLNRTKSNQDLHWYKSLKEYYYRPEWELFDLRNDKQENINVVNKPFYRKRFKKLQKLLFNWQNNTSDPWLCSPHGVLQDSGVYKHKHECLPLLNEGIYWQNYKIYKHNKI